MNTQTTYQPLHTQLTSNSTPTPHPGFMSGSVVQTKSMFSPKYSLSRNRDENKTEDFQS